MQAPQPKRRATMSDKPQYHSSVWEAESPWYYNGGLSAADLYSSTAAAESSSPISGSCITDDVSDLQYKLREIETVMLGPDQTGLLTASPAMRSHSDDGNDEENWGHIAEAIGRRDVNHVLMSCARAVSENDLMMSHWLIDELRRMVSVSGDPSQRLGAYMLEGLVARLGSTGSSICKAGPPAQHAHVLYELCPYFKFGYMSANGAIAEAVRGADRVHIVDFRIGHGSQWVTLIQAFAGRAGGAPRIRITAVGGGGAAAAGRRLRKVAEECGVGLEYEAAEGAEGVRVRGGEAVAVNFAFALSKAADESVTVENRRDRLLRVAAGLGPRVVTLVERESNTNTAAFPARFVEALGHYAAVFESIDEALPRDHKGRIGVEQQCLAREVVNIVACEGVERVERHEPLGKWRSRLRMAGFRQSPLSPVVNATVKRLMESYGEKYSVEDRDGALYLGWRDRFLVTSSAWKL